MRKIENFQLRTIDYEKIQSLFFFFAHSRLIAGKKNYRTENMSNTKQKINSNQRKTYRNRQLETQNFLS